MDVWVHCTFRLKHKVRKKRVVAGEGGRARRSSRTGKEGEWSGTGNGVCTKGGGEKGNPCSKDERRGQVKEKPKGYQEKLRGSVTPGMTGGGKKKSMKTYDKRTDLPNISKVQGKNARKDFLRSGVPWDGA